MQTNYKKIIFTTILYTLLVLVVATTIMILLMYFVFTKDCANFMYNIGNEKTAASLYYKTYKKTGEIKYCYKALNINIKVGNKENVVKYYEILIEDDEYAEFINSIIENNESLPVGVLEKSSILNEEDYLTTKYVRALVATNNKDKAWKVTISNFANYNTWTFNNQGVYALSEFVNDTDKYLFNLSYDGFESNIISEMQTYFNNIVEVFNANKNTTDSLSRAYLMALGNRIIGVGQDINNIYGSSTSYSDLKNSNVSTMVEVNNVIKGLL